jgi:hypothetical protein
VLHHIALLCAPSGYVLRGASGSVFSLLSTKSLVELQHIIGTGCGGRCVGRVADYPRQAAGARQSPRSGDIRSSRRRVRESPPTTAHWTDRFHAAGSRRISDDRAREHRSEAVDYVLRLVTGNPEIRKSR